MINRIRWIQPRLPLEVAARALQLTERETGRVLECARAYLRQTLLEAGCLWQAAANQ
jgi:hypothetical protein